MSAEAVDNIEEVEEVVEESIEETVAKAMGEEAKDPEADQAFPVESIAKSVTPAKEIPAKLVAEPTPDFEYPRFWKKGKEEVYKGIPKELKEEINRQDREAQAFITKKSEDLSRRQQKYQEFDNVLAPVEERLALMGVSSAQFVRQLVALHSYLERDPKSAIKDIADSYRLNLQDLSKQDVSVDPQYRALADRQAQLERELQGRQAAEVAYHKSQVDNEVHRFATERDQSGNPVRPFLDEAHPHFQEFYEHMLLIAEGLKKRYPEAHPRAILDVAYDRAQGASPSVRQGLIEAQTKELEAKRVAEQKEKSKQAKRSGVSVMGAPEGIANGHVPDSLEDTIRAAFDGTL